VLSQRFVFSGFLSQRFALCFCSSLSAVFGQSHLQSLATWVTTTQSKPTSLPNSNQHPLFNPKPTHPPQVLLQWITYLRYVSATYYSFEAASINEFGGVYLSCADGMSPTEINFLLGAFPNSSDTQRNQIRLFFGRADPNCVLDTNSIITYFNFHRPFWMSATILAGYLLAPRAPVGGAARGGWAGGGCCGVHTGLWW